jgi:anti-anti-sigma factor
MSMIAFEHRMESDVHVLTPRRNLVGGQETVALAGAVGEFAAEASPRVILDLHRINWVSSLGIEELRRMHRACMEQDGWMRLACVGEHIESIILTMRLDWVFDTFDTVEEAVAAPKRRDRLRPPARA